MRALLYITILLNILTLVTLAGFVIGFDARFERLLDEFIFIEHGV